MRARRKELVSPDVPDLKAWAPADESFWGFVIQAMIGPVDGDGAESFDITVCTPSWFAAKCLSDRVRSGEHTLFMEAYDYQVLASYLERRVNAIEGDTWPEIAARLAGLGHWEFDNYRATA